MFEYINSDQGFLKPSVRKALIAIIIFAMAFTVYSSSDQQKKITEKLNTLVVDTNREINETISGAINSKHEAEMKVAMYTECIKVNESLIEKNKNLTLEQFTGSGVYKPIKCEDIILGTATGTTLPVPPKSRLTPDDLFFTANVKDHCYPSQTPSAHYKANRRLAWDVVCDFNSEKIGQFILYAPDFKGESQEFKVTAVYYSNDTGNTIDLTFGNKRFTIGHIETYLKVGERVATGQKIGRTDLSGTTTGYHSHIELWIEGINVPYDTYSSKLDTARKTPKPTVPYGWGSTYYFTAYNLGDVNQNDSAPCNGASGNDLCKMEAQGIRTIALTKDVRDSLHINFGDKIKLEGACGGIYQVEDEMNCRFRGKPCWYKKDGKMNYHPTGNILRDGTPYYIKGDIPSCGGGAHKILPIN